MAIFMLSLHVMLYFSIHFTYEIEFKIRQTIFLVYVSTVIIDVICLVVSGILMLILSRKLTSREKNKFIEEKTWFWRILILLVVMTISWTTELLIWKSKHYFLFNVSVLIDFIKVFGAINIFVLFIKKENVKNILKQ